MLQMVLLQIESGSGTFAPNIIKAVFSSRSQPEMRWEVQILLTIQEVWRLMHPEGATG